MVCPRWTETLMQPISLDDVVATAFLSGPGSTTLPIVILSRARLGLNPTVNAIATITVAAVSVAVLTGSLWLSRQQKRRAAEQAAAYREGLQELNPSGPRLSVGMPRHDVSPRGLAFRTHVR